MSRYKRLRLSGLSQALMVSGALMSALWSTSAIAADHTPDHWRVIWQERPAREAFVSWTTLTPGTTHTVHYGKVATQGQTAAYSDRLQVVTTGQYSADQAAYYHHAKLEGLEPSTTYYFTIETDGELSPELHFVTAPEDERTFKVLYGGDSRSDRPDRQLMNQRVAAIAAQDEQILALVHGGDYVDDGYDWLEWREWLDDHELTVTPQGRILPIIAARGNHERDSVIYNYVFADPGGEGKARNYFVTELGPTVRLFNLDSSDSASGDQRVWLERALLKEQSTRWLIANYHIPAWPAVKLAGPAKLYWVPLFEQYNVDLVCESDGHVLKRTVPIRNDKEDPTGVVYVGEGGMGVKQREPDAERWYLKSPGMTMSGHHIQVLTFAPDKLTYQAILQDGSIADEYSRSPRPERMLAPFEVTKVQRGGMAGIDLFFSYSLDEDTIIQSEMTVDQGAKIARASLRPDRQTLRVEVEGLVPGTEYTLGLGDIRDYSGRALLSQQAKFLMPGEAPVVDMGSAGEDMSGAADMGSQPKDMGAEMSGPSPAPPKTDTEDGGCSSTSATKAAPGGLLVVFGLIWMWQRRRRRDEDAA